MIRRVNRLIAVLLIVALALYVVMLNRENATVHLSPSYSLTTSGGVVLIAVFVLGVLCTTIVAVYLGVKGWVRERRLVGRERATKQFLQALLNARGYMAGAEWDKAEVAWSELSRRDPTNILSRIELSRSLEGAGEPAEALRVLDAARTADPQNVEVLFRCAQINVSMGNKTAAVDNLSLVLQSNPSKKAAEWARNLCEDLGRLDDALGYQAKLDSLSGNENDEILARLELKKLLQAQPDAESKYQGVIRLSRQHRSSIAVLHELAQLERSRGKLEEAAQALMKAAKLSGTLELWRETSALWIAEKLPERALAAARTAAKETSGATRLGAYLDLILLYLTLNMTDDAKAAIVHFDSLAGEEGITPSHEMQHRLLTLKGLLASLRGESQEAVDALKKLVAYDVEREITLEKFPSSNREAPSPRLSTP